MHRLPSIRPLVIPIVIAVAALLTALVMSGVGANAAPKSKVTICHATASRTNPYVEITVAPESIFKLGHDVHQDGRDIIPPFEYLDNRGLLQKYPGKNWHTGTEEILANGCDPLSAPEPIAAGEQADITMCHRTASPQYVRVHVSWRDVISAHADDHPLDVIPPFSYTAAGGTTTRFPGQNWDDAGVEIFDAGCVAPDPVGGAVADEPIGISVACVQVNDDGTYDAVFGYDNPNAHDVTLPVGALNTVSLSPGPAGSSNRGQPTTFGTSGMNAAFTIRDIPAGQAATWRVAHEGTVEATAGVAVPVRCRQPAPGPTGPATDPVPPPPETSPLADAVGVFVDCVAPNATGTAYSVTFGYVNPGTETITIPIGAGNRITGLTRTFADQPTVLVPGSVVAFTIDDIPATRTPTWTLTLPDGREVSASPSPTDPACAVQPDNVIAPELVTEVTPPETPVVPGTPTTYEIDVDDDGPDPAVRVVIVIPPPSNGDEITKVAPSDGISCIRTTRGAYAGGAVCRAPVVLPGDDAIVTVQIEAVSTTPMVVQATARGRAVNGARLLAVDSDRVRTVRRVLAVTG